MKDFTRKELQELRMKAEDNASVHHLNTSWKRVYLRLADAASTLDAFIARTEDTGKELKEKK